MADPSAFVITELTGDKRTLELRGRALPYRSFKLGGKTRAEFTWYPGNPNATVQMLGAEETPTTLSGKWKDRFIKAAEIFGRRAATPEAVALFNGQQVADALALTQAVEQIRLAGQLVRVTWDEQVREGIMTSFEATWERREDVSWEMEFTWSSRGEPKQPITFVVAPHVGDLAGVLRSKVDALQDLAAPVFEARSFVLRTLDGFMDELEASASAVEDTATSLADAQSTPDQAAQRTLAAFESVKGSCGGIVSLLESLPASSLPVPPSFAPAAGPGSLPAAPELGEVLEADKWARGVRNAARELELLSAQETERLRALVEKEDLLAAFVAREDLDLRDVATQFYGDQTEWRRIKKYNRFSSSRLIAGDLVLVPVLLAEDRAA